MNLQLPLVLPKLHRSSTILIFNETTLCSLVIYYITVVKIRTNKLFCRAYLCKTGWSLRITKISLLTFPKNFSRYLSKVSLELTIPKWPTADVIVCWLFDWTLFLSLLRRIWVEIDLPLICSIRPLDKLLMYVRKNRNTNIEPRQ